MKPWRRKASRRVERCGIFDLDRVEFQPPEGGPAHPFYVIECPDWINVIPLTDRGEVLLVRQFRFGIQDFTLEIPGGMCDPGETPVESARRELREEVERETGIPAELTQRLVDALAGADHLGSLLKIDAAVDEAIAECEELLTRPDQAQGDFFSEGWKDRRISIDVEEAKATLLSRLEKKSALLAHKKPDGINYFTPLVDEATYMRMATSHFVDRLFGGNIAPLIASFARDRPLDSAQLAELQGLLKELSDDD